MKPGNLFLGVLAGVAAGATIGLLYAPDKGTSTRRKISDKRSEYAEELEGKFNEYINKLTRKGESVKTEANRLFETGKSNVEETVSELTSPAHYKMR